jgi:hypothetical protein
MNSVPAQAVAEVTACPGCGGTRFEVGWSKHGVPVMNTSLCYSPASAHAVERGEISLARCHECGLVFNRRFSPFAVNYGELYEETQHYSPCFSNFEDELVRQLMACCGLRGKTICDIGCGKADFLRRLCASGQNRGIGIDPAICPERIPFAERRYLQLEQRHYEPGEPLGHPDLVSLKMTLEHIAEPLNFLRGLRASLVESGCPLFIQVPNGERVLETGAFWDVYYEHCHYFSPRSMRALLARAGFTLERLWTVFSGQYICLIAHPVGLAQEVAGPIPTPAFSFFSGRVAARIQHWHALIERHHRRGRPVFLWGGGSKAVAFLSALDAHVSIKGAVDINPHKQGTWLPGSGLPIEGPRMIRRNPDSLIIVMNPNYKNEVRRMLADVSPGPRIEALV